MNREEPADEWHAYFRACARNATAVRYVDDVLVRRLELGEEYITPAQLARELVGKGVSHDFASLVLDALVALDVAERMDAKTYHLLRSAFEKGRTGRESARSAIHWAADEQAGDSCALVLSRPADAPAAMQLSSDTRFLDLRTSVRSLIAGAQHRLVLASPFWDAEVAADLGELIQRRVESGVRVTVLARSPRGEVQAERALAALAFPPRSSSIAIRVLDRADPNDRFGWSTFHFKAAIADESVAYVGSANFNTAGLLSRWELGVVLRGTNARLVSQLVESLCVSATPYSL